MQNKKAVPVNYIPTQRDIQYYDLALFYISNGDERGLWSLLGSILHLVDFPVKNNESLMQYACLRGRIDCALVMIKAGSSLEPEWTKDWGLSFHPLYFVIIHARDATLLSQLLETRRLSPNHMLKYSSSTTQPYSILDVAILQPNTTKHASLLMDHGATVRKRWEYGMEERYVRIKYTRCACHDAVMTTCSLFRSGSAIVMDKTCQEPIKIIAKMIWNTRMDHNCWSINNNNATDDAYQKRAKIN